VNYAELIEEISGYLQENDEDSFVARLDDFVIGAEQTIYRNINLPVTRFIDDGNISCVVGNATISTPTNWLEIFSLSVKEAGLGTNETRPLYERDPSYIREVYPVSTETGTPRDYAIIDESTLLLGPTPDATYPLLFQYKKFPESIVTAGTTWLGDNCEQALLFGAIYNAYIYLKGEPDLLQQYGQKFLTEMQALGYEGDSLPGDRRETT
jgi:hypothetical protein